MKHTLRKLGLLVVVFSLVAVALVQGSSVTTGKGVQLGEQSIINKDTCTREAMDQCEYSCMMPGGILDLNCYEDCIYRIC